MKKIKINPFPIMGYLGKEYFCDRKEELKKLLSAANNQRNIVISSVRKQGKTALIKHFFQELNSNNEFGIVYFDILPTKNLNEFIHKFSNGIIEYAKKQRGNFFNKLLKIFTAVKPIITYDSLTGSPTLSFKFYNDEDKIKTIEQIFKIIDSLGKRIIIAVDEFQQITNYPENNVEAILRTYIQESNNSVFIFSGSHTELLNSMFNEYSRPFYGSSEFLYLDIISPVVYREFIKEKFKEGKKQISDKEINLIFEYTDNRTYYVQYICNKLYSLSNRKINEELINEILYDILKSFESTFVDYSNLLTAKQYKLLKAVAKENKVTKPNSGDFIRKYDLKSASSVNRALDVLINKFIVLKDKDTYSVYDIFLSKWLERQF